MAPEAVRTKRAGQRVDANHPNPSTQVGKRHAGSIGDGVDSNRRDRYGQSGGRTYKNGFVDGEYQSGEVRGIVTIFGKRGSGKTFLAKRLCRSCIRLVVWDPMACCGDMGFSVVHQPGELRSILARAGKTGPFAVVYQPQSGDVVEHFEHVGWMSVAATNCVLMADEIDQVCSAGSPKNAQSGYWKRAAKGPALDHLVNYGRHCHVACIFIARAPQDVWRRLTGSSSRCIVFRMNERLEMEAVQGRLGEEWTRQLPGLAKYEYVDWYDDGEVEKSGGKL